MDETERTLFVSNLHEDVSDELLYELFLQGGPIDRVNIPRNNGISRNFGFVVYRHTISIPYAIELFSNTSLFKRRLNLRLSRQQSSSEDRNTIQQTVKFDTNSLRSGSLANNFALNNMGMLPNSASNSNLNKNSNNLQFDPNMLLQLSSNLLLGNINPQMFGSSQLPLNLSYPSMAALSHVNKMTNRDERNHQRSANLSDPPYRRDRNNDRNNHRNERNDRNNRNDRDEDENRNNRRDRDRDIGRYRR